MKIDSDVLFVGGFDHLLAKSPEALGVSLRSLYPWLGNSYQGGCYFLRSDTVKTLLAQSALGGALRMTRVSSLHALPEDQTVSLMLDRAKVPRTFGNFYFNELPLLKTKTFDPESLKKALRLNPETRVIHFEGCKQHMSAVSRLLTSVPATLLTTRPLKKISEITE